MSKELVGTELDDIARVSPDVVIVVHGHYHGVVAGEEASEIFSDCRTVGVGARHDAAWGVGMG